MAKSRIAKVNTVLVTGSSGLIGSEAVGHFDRQGHHVIGVDNNMRRMFFGPPGDTTWILERLKSVSSNFLHANIDIGDRAALEEVFRGYRFDLIVHCAAQPSHDKARDMPIIDFGVNALGTLDLPEATRQHCPDAVFVLMSTNKVCGDTSDKVPMQELKTRCDRVHSEDYLGIAEPSRIDQTLHLLDGDDWWAPGKLSRVSQLMASHPSLGVLGHSIVESLDDDTERIISVGAQK